MELPKTAALYLCSSSTYSLQTLKISLMEVQALNIDFYHYQNRLTFIPKDFDFLSYLYFHTRTY